jgi:hypothetical protein
MTKKLLFSSLLITLLCGPALAGDRTLQLGFTITSGKDVRHYAIKVVNNACGELRTQTSDFTDELKACPRDAGKDLALEVEWTTRQGDHSVHNRSVVLAQTNPQFQIDGGSAKLEVVVQ